MKGYQHEFIREVKNIINIPLTVLGGAGSYKDISSLFSAFGVVGAAAGSLFVFKGKYRAVREQPGKRFGDRGIAGHLRRPGNGNRLQFALPAGNCQPDRGRYGPLFPGRRGLADADPRCRRRKRPLCLDADARMRSEI